MASYENFNRQYRIAAGPAGAEGFEIGATSPTEPIPLHIDFSFEKSELEALNTGKITVWNLSPEHLAIMNRSDCALVFRAGYGNRLPKIFSGIISFIRTEKDGADQKTEIEVTDSLVEIRDTFVSVSYNGTVNWKKIFDDVAAQMGVAVTYSYNAEFVDIRNGFSYVGLARDIMTKGCDCCGLSWSLQNGVMQVKKPGDVMSLEAFRLAADTGLINIPARVSLEKSTSSGETDGEKQMGWEVEYLLNGAIDINDYVELDTETVKGYFRVNSLEISGDNLSGDWLCKARLLEVAAE